MAKYMLIMRDSEEAFEASQEVPFEEIVQAMGAYNERLLKAGVLAAVEGLEDASLGVVVDYAADPPLVTDGPYGEVKELFNGFWILEVASKEKAVEWARRAPLGAGSKMEVRRLPSIEEYRREREAERRREAPSGA